MTPSVNSGEPEKEEERPRTPLLVRNSPMVVLFFRILRKPEEGLGLGELVFYMENLDKYA
jgi:hypothetical protein